MVTLRLPGLLLGLSFLTIGTTQADQAILIGGGYNVNGSQGQIELNVTWAQSVLQKAGLPVVTFFTDGEDPAPDVHYIQSDTNNTEPTALDQLAQQLEPVARLFGDHHANQVRFRNHTIDGVSGGTEATALSESLTNILRSAPDDPSLIVFNGHGSPSDDNPAHVTMELWDNTQLSATQLHSILGESNAPSRFVFTQCFSGGFHRLAYDNPEQGLKLSSNMRCGFTAESAYRLAEGCSASIDTSDYRDYSTYFFAALEGYDREGEILPVDTDTDGNGEISMREAHFYTLEHAHSTDLSRSTSEDYLSGWQPWYLKWNVGKSGLPNNEYAKLFRALADKHSIPLDGKPAKSIRAKMKTYEETKANLVSRRIENQATQNELQSQLIYDAQSRWPALTGPYTAMFQVMAASGEMMQIAQWITEQSDYQRLTELQEEDALISRSILDAERNHTQMQKLFQFRKLAKLKHQLYQYGTPEQVKDYERLTMCEDMPFNITQ